MVSKTIKQNSWLKFLSLFLVLMLILPLFTVNVSAVSSIDLKDATRFELQALVDTAKNLSPDVIANCSANNLEQLLYSTEKAEQIIANPGLSSQRVKIAALELQVAIDMAIIDVHYATIDDMQDLVKSGKLTYEELTRMYLTRIELYDLNTIKLNSVRELRADALDDARDCDRALADDPTLATGMFGIPVLVKGNINVISIPNASGSLALADNYPLYDAPLVVNLKAAGAVVLGTLNLTEFAHSVDSSMPAGFCALGGQVRNPYQPIAILGGTGALSPSGSSAGSGAAAAASLSAITVGTETTGSILSPASRNCLAAIKPTVGLISRYGVIPISTTQDTAGPMGRSVEDIAVLLGAMAGYDPNDPFCEGILTAGVEGVDYTDGLTLGDMTGKRIGLTTIPAASSAFYGQFQAVLTALRDAGATIVTNSNGTALTYPSTSGTNNGLILDYEFKRDLAAYLDTTDPNHPIKTLADVIAFNLEYETHSPGVAIPYRQRWLLAAESVDLVTQKAQYDAAIVQDGIYGRSNGIDYVLNQNNLDAIIHTGTHDRAARAGYPVISVPLQYAGGNGASTNMIILGTAFSEAELLKIAYIAEKAVNSRVAPGMADKSSLRTAVAAAQALSTSARAPIQTIYNASFSAYGNSFLFQVDIDKADVALREALLGLNPVDKTALDDLLDLALRINPAYLGEKADQFIAAREAAWDASAFSLALQTEVNPAYNALFNLMADYSFLQAMVDYAEIANETYRLKDSFVAAFANAKAVLADPAAPLGEYFAAVRMLNDALDPAEPVYASVGATPQTHFTNTVEYTLALREAVNVLAVDFEFMIDGAMLAGNSFTTLNGFEALESIKWTDNGDGTWTGAVRFGYPGEKGFSTGPYEDVAKFFFDSTGLMGEATLTITKIQVTGLDENAYNGGGAVKYFDVIIEAGQGTTILFNKYDINKDRFVDLVDLGILLLYVGYTDEDPEWDTLIKAYDKNGKGITAKDCDVNGDGEVDMADLVELLANFGING